MMKSCNDLGGKKSATFFSLFWACKIDFKKKGKGKKGKKYEANFFGKQQKVGKICLAGWLDGEKCFFNLGWKEEVRKDSSGQKIENLLRGLKANTAQTAKHSTFTYIHTVRFSGSDHFIFICDYSG